jgi:sulfur carrier protein
MEVTVNQQKYAVSETCSVEELVLKVLNRSVQGIAIAINQNIVPKSDWTAQQLHQGDEIVMITATQGG